MNKGDLVAAVAEKAGLNKKQAMAAVDALLEAVSEELQKGGEVQLVGFGKFAVVKRAARTGRNPQTGASISVPAGNRVVFKPGATLKQKVC